MATKVISKSYTQGQQSHEYQEVLSIDDVKLRLFIKRDAYEFQSYAYIEAFSKADLKWNSIHSIPYQEIKMKTSYVSPANAASFKADRDELVRVATELLA